MSAKSQKAAILGTVGVPGSYGGFETLAENLVAFHEASGSSLELGVYCSTKAFPDKPAQYRGAALHYVPLDANGVQSIAYDIIGLLDAWRRGYDSVLVLGVSGAAVLPLLRRICRMRIIMNVDGIEWKREKWQGLAKLYLRYAERAAVKASHVVIADNQAIADYLLQTYGCEAVVLSYGGDHALEAAGAVGEGGKLPANYALGLCRIEPENNVAMILEAFANSDMPLAFVGNWDKSAYGRALKERYADHSSILIHDPVYDPARLRALRDGASLYVHGHSAGGTNPALVEMMHFGIPVAAHGCAFNRYTTEEKAMYFTSAEELREVLANITDDEGRSIGRDMAEIARRRYTWAEIGRAYLDLLET